VPDLSLTIAHAKAADRAEAFAFHHQNAGEFLWPRTPEQFRELVDARQLFILRDVGEVAGLCYVKPDEDAAQWEFGGIFVHPALRGRGAAGALGRVAISAAYQLDEPNELIAHVHEANPDPRGLLVNQLGFVATGEQEGPPPEMAPQSMRRNEEGLVVGDVFRFERAELAGFADWFEAFDGTLAGRGGVRTPLALTDDLFEDLGALAGDLRDLAEDRYL
jgi:GNAT superfamily N-acetyltransferase